MAMNGKANRNTDKSDQSFALNDKCPTVDTIGPNAASVVTPALDWHQMVDDGCAFGDSGRPQTVDIAFITV